MVLEGVDVSYLAPSRSYRSQRARGALRGVRGDQQWEDTVTHTFKFKLVLKHEYLS